MNINKILKVEKYALDILKICTGINEVYKNKISDMKHPIMHIPLMVKGSILRKGEAEVDENEIFLFNGFDYTQTIIDKFPFVVTVPHSEVIYNQKIIRHIRISVGYNIENTEANYYSGYDYKILCIDCYKLRECSLENVANASRHVEEVFDYLDDIINYEEEGLPGCDAYEDIFYLITRSVFNSVMNGEGKAEEFNYDTCYKYYSDVLSDKSFVKKFREVEVLNFFITRPPNTINSLANFLRMYFVIAETVFDETTKNKIRSRVRLKLNLSAKYDKIIGSPDN